MNKLIGWSLWIGLAGMLASAAGMGQIGDPAPAPVGPALLHEAPSAGADEDLDESPINVSDADLETFATLYVALRKTAERYERRIAAADSERDAQEVQAQLQQESLEALERHGWTAEEYERIGRAVSRRPELVEKALRLIESRS